MSEFKIGDRVIYAKGTDSEDRGVITRPAVSSYNFWWIKWDSDGKELTLHENDMELENEENMELENEENTELPHTLIINGVKYQRVN